MMNSEKIPSNVIKDIPQKIFERFLEELKSAEVPLDVIEHLENVILTEDNPSEQTIKKALFSDTQTL
jgi:hypothetical protein